MLIDRAEQQLSRFKRGEMRARELEEWVRPIRNAYLMYIGAGAVAAGGIISLFRSLPTIVRSIRSGLADFRQAAGGRASILRTERDLSMKFVGAGLVALVLAILVAPTLHMNVAGAVLIVIFGFLFVTVSSRLTGEIGSSSNPISGMTVATLLVTCLFFLLKGWTGPAYFVTALSVGAVVCIAASNGGTTSQDLKTGHLVGATPKYQQIAILMGTAVSALMLGPILLGLNDSATVYVPAAKVAPGLHAPAELKLRRTETLPRSQFKDNTNTFRVWHKHDLDGAPPEDYLGDVMGDLNSRRGRVEGLEPRGNAQAVRARVPLATMFGYATDLRSMTQGRATFTMQFDRYEEAPQSVAGEIVSAAQAT
jgi:hypothetical protein